MRKFKVECLFDSFGGEDTHWQEVEAENYEQAEEKARSMYSCDIDIGEILDIYDTPLNNKYVLFDSVDGFTYGVPVMFFAEKRAYRYWNEFDQDVGRSMIEDTLPLFESNPSEIIDYAKGNFNWDDVKSQAIKMERKDKPKPDYQDEWVNNKFTIK